MSPPGATSATPTRITGTGNSNAENKRRTAVRRETSARIIKAMRAAGMTPHGWQVRSLMSTLLANHEAPSEAEVVEQLMRANWFPKRQIRRWRVGEGGGWGTRS